MDIVKKNIVSIVCGVIAIVAVVVIFYPIGGMYARMETEVKQSHAVGESLNKVRSEQRFWPTLSVKEEDKVQLKHFPTQPVKDVGTKVTESWTKQATDFLDAAVRVQSENLKLLVPGSLPGGTGQKSVAYQFKNEYRKLFNMDAKAVDPTAPPAPVKPGPVLNTPLVGRMPPTEADIKAQSDAIAEKLKTDMPVVVGGAITNQAEVDAEIVRQGAAVGDRLRSEVALSSMVYLDPVLGFVANDKIAGNTAPGDDDIFAAQVGLWLQQEICRAVYETNKGTTQGVIDAPIKRLIGVRFAPTLYNFTAPVAGAPVAGAPVAAPAPTDAPVVPPMPAAKVAVDYTKNPLGHTTNDMYDVLPFNMAIVCEAETLPRTLANLSRGRYVSIKSIDVASVDSAVAYAQGFLFGIKPVVQVTLHCQYLMLRKFIGPLMPPDVIRGLALPAGAGPGAPPM